MLKMTRYALASALSLCGFAAVLADLPQNVKSPLDATTLVALVAGAALAENIVSIVSSRGLTFTPTRDYLAQLTTAGATPKVLNAVSKATVHAIAGDDESPKVGEARQHLALAGKLIRDNKFDEAAQELDEALRASSKKAPSGFVMGELLRRQENWAASRGVYEELLKLAPDFPELRVKLSVTLHRTGDDEECLRLAKATLQENPNNPEAHKAAALALEGMRKFDAAEQEFREALRLKPDYELIHFDLGVLLTEKNDLDGAIAEYKKALALKPQDVYAHQNLGLVYQDKKDYESAVRELRAGKKLDPKNERVRQNLASVLRNANLNADAVKEWRELQAMDPNSEVCHVCLASALVAIHDFDGAKKEYKIAQRMEPGDPHVHQGLGIVLETQKDFTAALKEYQEETRLDTDGVDGHWRAALLLLQMDEPRKAADELAIAEGLQPSNADVHEAYGRALWLLGDTERARSEFKGALLLDGESIGHHLYFAQFLASQNDWVGAMDHCRIAKKGFYEAISKPISQSITDARSGCQGVDLQLKEHLSELRTAGKSLEAADLEKKLAGSADTLGISGKLDAAMEAGANASRENNFADAEKSYKEAVQIAEQLTPHEGRLVMSLGYLGTLYFNRRDLTDAQTSFARELQVAEELYGSNSPQLSAPLLWLGRVWLEQGDPAKAAMLYEQNLALNEKNYGQTSAGYSMALSAMAQLQYAQKQFDKALPYIEQAVKIEETIYGPAGPQRLSRMGMLCKLYDRLEQPAKAEPCYRDDIALLERTYGDKSPALAQPLTSQAKALRTLGRASEADAVERHLQNLQQPTAGVN